MYIYRTRPKHSEADLKEIYAFPHDHTKWDDHIHRVQETIRFARETVFSVDEPRVIDLSCGDATIARALDLFPILGDFAPGYEFHGPIEKTIKTLGKVENSVFVLTETLEHIDNPYEVLAQISETSDHLLVSTPIHDGAIDENEEHYWSWDREGVEVFLRAAWWEPQSYREVYSGMGYRYGLWWCE